MNKSWVGHGVLVLFLLGVPLVVAQGEEVADNPVAGGGSKGKMKEARRDIEVKQPYLPRQTTSPQGEPVVEKGRLLKCLEPATGVVAIRSKCVGTEQPVWVLIAEEWVRIDPVNF